MNTNYAQIVAQILADRLSSENDRINDAKQSNNVKLARVIKMLERDDVQKLLIESNVDAREFDKNVYALSEKASAVIELAAQRVSLRAVNHTVAAIFATACKIDAAKIDATRDDFKAAISNFSHREKSREVLIERSRDAYDVDSTINAQSSSTVQALLILNMISEAKRDTFKLNRENAFTKALADAMSIKLISEESESAES